MIDHCRWPELDERYSNALRSCVTYVFESFQVEAILASGTIIRGEADPRSDLDVHVLHSGSFRRRLQRFFHGVPCEIFVNPPSRVRRYFEEDAADRRPMTPHMFATGFAIYDPRGLLPPLIDEAKAVMANLPPGSTSGYYGAATAFEDVEDVAERDPEAASVMLGDVVWDLVSCRLAAEPGYPPRAKDALKRLKEIDAECARLAIAASGAADLDDRIATARELCRRVTGHTGFFEWASEPEEVLSQN